MGIAIFLLLLICCLLFRFIVWPILPFSSVTKDTVFKIKEVRTLQHSGHIKKEYYIYRKFLGIWKNIGDDAYSIHYWDSFESAENYIKQLKLSQGDISKYTKG